MIKLTEIYRELGPDLALVEEGLELAIDLDVHLLYETSTHLLKAGGKRIRPLFVLLSGQFGNYDISNLSKIAVALELIHMATLVHDDVIDDAQTRRGELTVKSKWDNKIAMYTGDYILSKGLLIVTEFPDPRIHRTLSAAIFEMVKGEIEQIKELYDPSVTLKHYLRRIKRKTALLISVSCELGALASNASPRIVTLLRKFGYYVGMAFQITDDILDFVGNEEVLGKPVGSDIRNGNVTLPVIYTIQHNPKREQLMDWIRNKDIDANMPQILDMIRETGGIKYSRDLASIYLQKAKQITTMLPDVPAKQRIINVMEFIAARNY